MKKITLHIGADKCGSSSIQKTLSNIDYFYDLENNKYSYGVIKNKDVYFQPEIKYLSKNNYYNVSRIIYLSVFTLSFANFNALIYLIPYLIIEFYYFL